MIKISKSPTDTQKLASQLAKKLKLRKQAIVIALEGELGAGKTVFTKGFAKALGVKQKVTSPTFLLLKTYPIKTGLLCHIDAYRLRDHRDAKALGLKELLAQIGNIILIEWSDRLKQSLPAKHIRIHIDHISLKERKISISNFKF